MPRIEHRLTINRPLIEVFRKATDFSIDSLREWQPDTQSVNLISGDPIRPGTMISLDRKLMGSSVFVNTDVIDFQRNKLMEVKGAHGSFPYHRLTEYTSSGGSTTIHDQIHIRVPWWRFWMIPFVGPPVRRQTAAEWQALKTLLESGSRGIG